MRKLFTLSLFALTSGVAGEATALDRNDLDALQTAVHAFCVQPDQKGKYLKIEGDLSAGATLKVVGVSGADRVERRGGNQQQCGD